MSRESWKMLFAVALAAVLASTGTYMAMSGNGDAGYNTIGATFPSLDLGAYEANDLFDMTAEGSDISRFGSFAEFKTFIGKHRTASESGYQERPIVSDFGGEQPAMAAADSGMPYHTDTNTQVAGVDEGDIVKNDGQHAYIISGSGESVFIVRAYPADRAMILSEIASAGTFVDMYIDGDRLIMLEQVYYFEGGFRRSSYIHSTSPFVNLKIFDISDRDAPQLYSEAVLGGNYLTSRLVDGKIYIVGNQHIQAWENESQLPLPIESLYCLENEGGDYLITTFLAADTCDRDATPSVMGIVMSSSNNIYVSNQNMYITHTQSREGPETEGPETTVVHRIGMQGRSLKYRAGGEVSGRLLNRFSMDEYNGHFRLATTKGRSWGPEESRNTVHILDMALEPTGKLDHIAPGEQIYSARFMGARLYLVTFRQVDPFYVIDLHDAENPVILGELKIPGYSSYLHPYDENHIIGLGRDGSAVKLSLFNVSDVNNPTELDTLAIGSGYSDSPALSDPHAFMFSPEKNLLVIPITDYGYSTGESKDGAYIFEITPERGIVHEGIVEHPGTEKRESEYYCHYSHNRIRRSFIIGDMLYTVSDALMKANSIQDLEPQATVELK